MLPKTIVIGRMGEQYSRAIEFDVSDELALWSESIPQLIYVRPGEKTAYPAYTTLTGTTLTWIPDAFATEKRGGDGAIQIVFTTTSNDAETIIGKSRIIRMQVGCSLETSEDPPEPYEAWITALLEAAGEATDAANDANEAAQDATEAAGEATTAAQNATQAAQEATDATTALYNAIDVVEAKVDKAQDDIDGIEGQVTDIKTAIQQEGTNQYYRVVNAGTAEIGLVQQEGSTQKTAVTNTGNAQVQAVQNAGNYQIGQVASAGSTQTGLVTAEGTRQIGLVNSAGTTQIGLIEDKINTFAGIEILDEGESPQHESTEVTLTPDAEDIDQIPQIDDTQLSSVDTWSSNKIHVEDCFEVSASGSVVTVQDGADNVPIKSMTVQIVAQQSGEGDPSPTNIRPISGFDSVTVKQTGKNLINPALIEDGYINASGEQSGSSGWSRTKYIEIEPSTTYTFSVDTTAGNNAKHAFYDSTETFISVINSGSSTFTTPNDAKYIRLSFRAESTTEQLEAGSTATAYEPYVAPVTTTIDLPTEAGTVYGGTLTINEDGTCELVSTMNYLKIKDISLSKQTVSSKSIFRSSSRLFLNNSGSMCECFKNDPVSLTALGDLEYTTTTTYWDSTRRLAIRDEGHSDVTTFKSDYGNYAIIGGYVEPITYNFTVDPNLIKTFVGYNQFQANTGDISITYRADKKLYVDTRLDALRALIGG